MAAQDKSREQINNRSARAMMISRSFNRKSLRFTSFQDHVGILRFDFEAVAATVEAMGGDEGCAGTEKRIVHDIVFVAVIANRSGHAFERLLRTVSTFNVLIKRDFPNGCLSSVASELRRLAFSDGIPTRFMSPVVIASANGKVWFAPNDLASDSEPGRLNADLDLGGTPVGVALTRFEPAQRFVAGCNVIKISNSIAQADRSGASSGQRLCNLHILSATVS